MHLSKFLSVSALALSVAWFIAKPEYEPAIAIIVSLSALLTTFTFEKKPAKTKQAQVVGKSGVGIQAGGDICIGDVSQKGKNTDVK